MNSDQILVLGLVLGALSVPALLSAYAETASPRVGMVLAIAAISLVALAMTSRPSGYELSEVPQVFFRVIGNLVN